MRTPRLSVVDWTEAPADLNWLVRFAERRNLVSARVPSHFNWPLLPYRSFVTSYRSHLQGSKSRLGLLDNHSTLRISRKSANLWFFLNYWHLSAPPPLPLHCCSSMQIGVSKDLSAFAFRDTQAASNFTVRSCDIALTVPKNVIFNIVITYKLARCLRNTGWIVWRKLCITGSTHISFLLYERLRVRSTVSSAPRLDCPANRSNQVSVITIHILVTQHKKAFTSSESETVCVCVCVCVCVSVYAYYIRLRAGQRYVEI